MPHGSDVRMFAEAFQLHGMSAVPQVVPSAHVDMSLYEETQKLIDRISREYA
jgi:hypothetical protein